MVSFLIQYEVILVSNFFSSENLLNNLRVNPSGQNMIMYKKNIKMGFVNLCSMLPNFIQILLGTDKKLGINKAKKISSKPNPSHQIFENTTGPNKNRNMQIVPMIKPNFLFDGNGSFNVLIRLLLALLFALNIYYISDRIV